MIAPGFLLLLLASSPAPTLSPNAAAAMGDWTLCQGRARIPVAAATGPAAAASEAVLKACEADQRRFLAALRKDRGGRARKEVADLREGFRITGIAKVTELRAGTALGDIRQIWSSCVGAHSIEKSPAEPAEAAADRALDSCLVHEDAVVAEAITKLGPEQGPGVRRRFRAQARAGIVELITSCRADSMPAARPECAQDETASN